MYNLLVYIFIIDLVLGGAGTYFYIGPLSARKVLYIILIFVSIFQFIKIKKISNSSFSKKILLILSLILLSFIISTIMGFYFNPINLVISKFLSYSYIFLLPFLFFNVKTKESCMKFFDFFNKIVILLAGIAAVLFILLVIFKYDMYQLINPILLDYQFGHLDITPSYSRVFLKTGIFIPFTLNYLLLNLICSNSKPTFKDLCIILVLFVAIYSSMTMGIWAVCFVGVMICICVFGFKYKQLFKLPQVYFIIATVLLIIIIILYSTGILPILIQRMNKNDFSFQVKSAQINEMLLLFKEKPFFGHGFGKVFSIDVANYQRTSSNWEIMWLELLINSGIIGLTIFLSIIIYPIYYMILLIKQNLNQSMYLTFIASYLGLIVINFSNPFLNNPIGIGYLIFTLAIINVSSRGYSRDSEIQEELQ